MNSRQRIHTIIVIVLIGFILCFLFWIHLLYHKFSSPTHIPSHLHSDNVHIPSNLRLVQGMASIFNLSHSFGENRKDYWNNLNISNFLHFSSEYNQNGLNSLNNQSHEVSIHRAQNGPTICVKCGNETIVIPPFNYTLNTILSSPSKNKYISLLNASTSSYTYLTLPVKLESKAQAKVPSNDIPELCLDSNFNLCKPIPNLILQQVYKVLSNRSYEDIIAFNGQSVKKDFDPQRLIHGVSLTGRTANLWKDVAHLINQSYELQHSKQSIASTYPKSMSNTGPKTVHIHNELKFGDFLELIIKQHRKIFRKPIRNRNDFYRAFDLGQAPIVITNTADENWGLLSTPINGRTTRWINMTNHLLIHGANYQMVKDFFASNKLTLLVTSNHVDPQIGSHEKIIGLPLGTKSREKILNRIIEFSRLGLNKTRLLLINNSGWHERSLINAMISNVFNNKVKNTYKIDSNANRDHYRNIAESIFVICPSGLGFDTYRLWETILFGSIPIVESNAGFDRTYANLPVLVVRNYSDVNPTLLRKAYECLYRYHDQYRYIHLTKSYWMSMVYEAIYSGNISHVTTNHPFRNHYCDFIDHNNTQSSFEQ